MALRPQVTGWVQKILFQAGQRVREKEVLFVIDPRPYQANLGEALGAVADAEASLARAHQDVARYEPLLPDNAIPRATYDAAVATEKSARAALVQKKAAVDRARLDLDNTKVRSPVAGQIGLQQVEVGALASAGQTVLATVSTLDPVFVYFSISESGLHPLRARQRLRAKQPPKRRAEHPIQLTLPDGTAYPQQGTFDFAERAISSTTGTLTLRAKYPNPQALLRPGMNVRVRLIYDEVPNALLVPQTSGNGTARQTVRHRDRRRQQGAQRPVSLGDRVGEMWIVKSGLKPGERIIVDGTQKAPPGTVVAATMITTAQLDQASDGTPTPVQAPGK